jgi:mannose-6-phosphate isomerase
MGAHPGAPSRLVRGGRASTLTEIVDADPVAELGPDVLAEHGPQLPFLLKLLAAERPLSIQAHPDATQARAGFAAEEAAGIPLEDPKRNYVDANHKPELLYAVTEFDALCGFRDPAETLAIVDRLDAPLLAGHLAALRERPDADGLRATLTSLLSLGDAARAALVAELVGAGRPYPLVQELGAQYPGDLGVVVALLLNHVSLAPGEVIFVSAGLPHAYLRGTGIELLASSDNVVRGGLTPKHVDGDELLRLLRFEPGPVRPLPSEEAAPGLRLWHPPVREFALARAEVTKPGRPVELPGTGPRILFCLTGAVRATQGGDVVELTAGQAVFVPAGPAVTLTGAGTLFQASTAL